MSSSISASSATPATTNGPAVERIVATARQLNKRIVLPETEDARVIRAADEIIRRRCASLVLLGKPEKIHADAKALGLDVSGAEIIDPATDARRDACIDRLFQARRAKGMTREQAAELLAQNVYYGGALVADGRVDGMVAGSNCPTATTVRSALYGPGLASGNKTVSSCSIMQTQIDNVGVQGALIFADTGVVPEPTVPQLADIAIQAALACRALLAVEPRVAMISFSTKGSAHSPAVQKVIDATKLAQSARPDLKIDGEFQVDAAIMPEIARRKAGDSPVAGYANVLVFPDLSCGNSAYKLVERLGRAVALGPLLLGLAKPINDLSRGCSVEDIVLITAVTAVQAAG